MSGSSTASSALSLITTWWESTTAENVAAAQASDVRSALYAKSYIDEEINDSLSGINKLTGENLKMQKKAQTETLLTFGAIGAVVIIAFISLKK